jgi:hypothetical protein
MGTGALLTKITIWIALIGYVTGIVLILVERNRNGVQRMARNAWTLGCVVFLAHVFCAFNYYYKWSHAVAYTETGRQTAEVVGEGWSVGVYVGYVFTLLWLSDVVWWWLSPQTHKRRSRILTAALHTFMFFIIFNGTVVFKSGMSRLLGVIIFLTLAVCGF